MTPQRRVIRKIHPVRSTGFDDHLWPVALALVVLVGLAVGIVVTASRFDDPRPLQNAWVRLAALAMVAALLTALAVPLSARLTRRLRLALVLSLIGHVLLAVVLYQQYLGLPAIRVAEATDDEPEEVPVVVPEYHVQPLDQTPPAEAFERPYQVKAPEAQTEELTRERAKARQTEALERPTTLPDAEPALETSLVELRRPQMAAAHRAPDTSELSRQQPHAAAPWSEPITAPQQHKFAGQPVAETLYAQRTPVVRRQTRVAVPSAETQQRHLTTTAQQVAAPQTVRVARTQSPALVPNRSARTPTVSRRGTGPATVATSPIDAEIRIEVAQDLPPPAPQPATTAVRRTPAASSNLAPAAVDEVAAARKGLLLADKTSQSRADVGQTATAVGAMMAGVRSGRAGHLRLPVPERTATAVPAPQRAESEALLAVEPIEVVPTTAAAAPGGSGQERPPVQPAPTAADLALGRAPPGAAAAPMAAVFSIAPTTVGAGVATPRRRRPSTAAAWSDPTSSLAGGMTGAPLRQATTASLAGREAVPAAGIGSLSDEAEIGSPALATAAGRLGRVGGSLIVRPSAALGRGGLGTRPSPEVGLPHRKAQRESQIVHHFPGKYPQRKIGAPAAISGRARDVAAAFTRRGERQRELKSGGDGRPLPKTEAAIESGLAFLARCQLPDGRWSLAGSTADGSGAANQPGSIQADSAATGLALLAYLGAGYDHYDDRYKDVVQRGLDFLVDHQRPSGAVYLTHDPESNRVAQLYSHSIATIALGEAVGMTGDPLLRGPAQQAIDFIVRSQHPQRGGWRYQPGESSDLSVTGWHLMALKSGELAGMDIPEETYTKVGAFLDRCRGRGRQRSLFAYNPYASDTARQRHGRQPSTVMTSIGLLMRLYTGYDRTDPDIQRGAEHLLANLPRISAPAPTGTLGNPMRDTYYWYHGTQVMFHMRGRFWSAWNGALHPILVDSQIRTGPLAGSWDARRPVPDRWGLHGGRIYVTTLNLLSLEVTYRHLPIYESTLDRPSKPATVKATGADHS